MTQEEDILKEEDNPDSVNELTKICANRGLACSIAICIGNLPFSLIV